MAICMKNPSPPAFRYTKDVSVGAYYKVIVARLTGSSGYVGLISDGGVELSALNDPCPGNNGYNNGYNNHYNNGYKAR